jgi:hypothetical protein
LTLAACGGGGGSATIGGTVTGLGNGLTLTLQDNGTDTFSIVGNGSDSFTFNFTTTVGSSDAYDVTVVTPQPLGQTCVVSNGSGTVDSAGDAVTSVSVVCTTTSSVAVSLTGLGAGGGVTLLLTDTTAGTTVAPQSLALAQNGQFPFPNLLLPAGNTYLVSVSTQPLGGQTCTVANPTGTVAASTTNVVTVSCI